jgi:LmbE family N-acetylglucosaminyl deacetylase
MSVSRKTIVAVLAHPDDESFGLGGTLALYARRGHRVALICATRGEAGTVDPEHMRGFATVAELREAELRCAALQLGLDAVHILGYRDSGMSGSADNMHPAALAAHPIEEVAEAIVKYIRELKPDVVLTFDPMGGYRHPDHIHVHRATTMAFEQASDSSFHPESGLPWAPRALFYHVFPHKALRFLTRIMPLFGSNPRRFGRNGDIDLVALTAFDFPTHVRIDCRPVASIKSRAGACHVSQGGMQMRRGLMGLLTRLMGNYENFMQAIPAVTSRHVVARDLLEGI